MESKSVSHRAVFVQDSESEGMVSVLVPKSAIMRQAEELQRYSMERGSQHSFGDDSGKTYFWRITEGDAIAAGPLGESCGSTTKGLAAVVTHHHRRAL